MIARYVQKGESIDYRPAAAVAAGDVIVLETLIGIARLDIAANTLGSLAVAGVFDAPKATGAVTAGSAVYWDAANSQVTTASIGNPYLGKAILAVGETDETARFLLNAPMEKTESAESSAGDAIADLTDNSGGTAADIIPAIVDADCQTAVASLAAKTNAILSALRTAGIIAAGE